MSTTNAKCPHCGTIVIVDRSEEASICQECKKPFVTSKAIEEYNRSTGGNYIDPQIKTMFDLGIQAFNGRNYNEAYGYFSSALQINSRVALPILYKGLTASYLSTLAQNACNIRLPELNAAIDLVFKNEELFSQLDSDSIDQFFYQVVVLVNTLVNAALKLYVPGYREMDNINMVWTALGEAYTTLTVMGSYFGVIYPDEVTDKQEKILKAASKLISGVLARLLDERIYSVAWGWRSGLGQRNIVRHPNYKELLAIKNEFDSETKKIFPDFTPIK